MQRLLRGEKGRVTPWTPILGQEGLKHRPPPSDHGGATPGPGTAAQLQAGSGSSARIGRNLPSVKALACL